MRFIKEKIRKGMKAQRAGQDVSGRSKKDKAIQKFLLSLEGFRKAKVISIYISRDGEVKTKSIIREALLMGKKITTPSFCANRPCMRLIGGGREVKPAKLDLIIVPGLAFDKKGGRLGRGGGYYDAFLKKVKGKISIIGLAYGFQVIKKVPLEPHDILVDKIITENGIIKNN